MESADSIEVRKVEKRMREGDAFSQSARYYLDYGQAIIVPWRFQKPYFSFGNIFRTGTSCVVYSMSMVDITSKPEVYREATAEGRIKLKPQTLQLIRKGKIEKGDPFDVARVAAVLAAKNTCSLIPLCHPLPLTNIDVNLKIIGDEAVEARATVKTRAQTGVEMEALTAVSVALLTVWDMTKQYEKNAEGQYPTTSIENIHVVRKVKKRK